MSGSVFLEDVKRICASDTRYDPEAYFFIREALDYTVKLYNKPREGAGRHVSGRELLEGLRRYALKEYGPMALTVLRRWGVSSTDDVGEIVFNLVACKRLGKTDSDSREDFHNGYDFRDAFRDPFLPANAQGTASRQGNERLSGARGRNPRAS
ncbi:MAG: hypothetical protein JW951_09530 [Lentisphaerae bacterium]|nr:hypothetical protein [Lentisphaerota bacterium]